jgi:CheY-like chemotaxis protein
VVSQLGTALAVFAALGVGVGGGAVLATARGRARRREVPPPASHAVDPPPTPPRPPAELSAGATPAEREIAVAWLRFLRREVADTVNAINNRLQVIRILASGVDRSKLTTHQVEALNQIDVEVGRAAAATASLHRHVSSATPEPARPSGTLARAERTRHGAILVVEGDDAGREAVGELFRVLGHRVIPARDGVEAFTILQQEPVDCVVADTRRSRLGGIGLYTQVEERLPHVARRFVFMSGDTQEPETRAFLDRVGRPVLPKPYDVRLLIDMVTAVLEQAEPGPAPVSA